MGTETTIKDINLKKEFIRYQLNNEYYRFLRKELTKYYMHGKTTTFYHCRHVAYSAFYLAILLSKKFHAEFDIQSLINAAIMHDLFMYDWHEKNAGHRLHGYTHPHTASKNAKKYCNASEKEQQIIESHMWPLTITKIPRSREAWLVCMCDKYCALRETLHR